MIFKTKRISIILLFIVSTMLIGIFSGCDNGEIITEDTATPQDSDNIESYESPAVTETSEKDLLKVQPSREGLQLTEDELREIISAYIKDDSPNFDTTYSITCWGKFGNIYAIYQGQAGYTVVTTEIVNGYKFIYPSSNKLEIYRNGEIFSMSDAFDKGIIDEQIVAQLYGIRHLFCVG